MTTKTFKKQRNQVLRRVVFGAVICRGSLVIPGGTVLAAICLDSGLLGFLAIAGFVVAVATDLLRPERWRRVIQQARFQPPDLAAPLRLGDPLARNLALRLERSRIERDEAYGQLSPALCSASESLLERAVALEEHAIRLLPVLDRLALTLGQDPTHPVRLEVIRLELAAAGAAPNAREEYERALQVVDGRLRLLGDVERLKGQLLARLDAILTALETVAASLVTAKLRQSATFVLEETSPAEGLLAELQTFDEATRSVTIPAPGGLARAMSPAALRWEPVPSLVWGEKAS
jgi:hypothetical protein